MIQTFSLAIVLEICRKVEEIQEDENVTSWLVFKKRLRDEYFDEDTKKVTKRSFLDWIELQPKNGMAQMNYCRSLKRNIINCHW